MLEIDGSLLEGGGQILRISIALSALLRKPIRIKKIRGNRPKPGLRPQHMCGLELVHQFTGGSLEGNVINSTQVTFTPGDITTNYQTHFSAEIPTNGATTLLAQIALPVALYRKVPTTLDLKGGTHTHWAPPFDYYASIFLPTLQSYFGIKVDCQLLQVCFNNPQGGGHLKMEIQPLKAAIEPGVMIERTEIETVSIYAKTDGKVPLKVARLMASSASLVLRNSLETVIQEDTQHYNNACGNGSFLFVKAKCKNGHFLGASALEEPKKNSGRKPIGGGNPEDLGRKTAEKFLAIQAPIDEFLQDQLLIFMALAKGQSAIKVGPNELTLHTQTAIHIIQLLTSAKFTVDEDIIKCEGIGFWQ